MPRKANKKPVTTVRVYTTDKNEIASIAGELQTEAGAERSHADAVAHIVAFWRASKQWPGGEYPV